MSIKALPDGRYRARYRDETGKEHMKTFTRKTDARAWENAALTAVREGTHIDPSRGRVTFREYAEKWQAMQEHRPSTADKVRRNLDKHIYPAIGKRRLVTLKPDDLKKLVRDLEHKGLSYSSVTVIYRTITAILKSAVINGDLARSPALGIKRGKLRAAPAIPISTEQVEHLIETAPDEWRAAITLAATTGLRQGEILGLTTDRINFLRRTVHVDRQMTALSGQAPQFGPPKTPSSERTVPLPDLAADAIRHHLDAYGTGREGLIFHRADGAPISRALFNAQFRRIKIKAGVDVTFHGLRHYYASLLIHGGASVKVVQARLGHASATETLDTYAHIWPDSESVTHGIIEAAFKQDAGRLRDRTPQIAPVIDITPGQSATGA